MVFVQQHINLQTTYIRISKHTQKRTLNIHFIFSNKENGCICRTCCIISVLFPIKCHLFHNFFILYIQIIHFL